ncbi:DUF4097 family beta strand repeat-containing protein [Bacillus spongiae]|uniref:DUF4097 family beta strand repeat-containing protein n=1 Tax=Bacillus spongiae TaxID=2683610 RepID=A0ABU8HE01_9BACI
MNKRIALSGLILFLIGVIGLFVMLLTTGGFSMEKKPIAMEKVIEINDLEQVTVQSTTIDLHYQSHDKENVLVKLSGDVSEEIEVDIRAEQKGKTLEITIDEDNWTLFSIFRFLDVEATIFLPNNSVKALDLQTTTGDVYVEEFDGAEIMADAVTGDVNIAHFNGTMMKGETTTGKLSLTDVVADTRLISTTGDVEFNGKLTRALDISTTTGSVLIRVNPTPSEYKLVLDSTTGDFVIDWPELQVQNDGHYTHSTGDGPKIIVGTTTGDVSLLTK